MLALHCDLHQRDPGQPDGIEEEVFEVGELRVYVHQVLKRLIMDDPLRAEELGDRVRGSPCWFV